MNKIRWLYKRQETIITLSTDYVEEEEVWAKDKEMVDPTGFKASRLDPISVWFVI